MSKHQYNVAILIPTRGRTDQLSRCIKSIVTRAVDKKKIQLLIGFDNDDSIGREYFDSKVQSWLDENEIAYTVLEFERMGYQGLNRYYNALAEHMDADWLFGWSDDAIMETAGWDRVITKHTGEFKLLKAHAHNEHPYSIFPMWPAEWYELFGHVSRHQMIDAELSQMAYMLDLIEIVDIYITHDRPDLTKTKEDTTHKERVLFEGNPSDPRDFHHVSFNQARINDSETIAKYLKSNGVDTTFWENVKTGKQDPWEKLKKNDPHGQMTQKQVRIA